MKLERVYKITFAGLYPAYVAKVEKKGRTKAELLKVIHWLTGYTAKGLEREIKKGTDLERFYKNAPKLNPKRKLITGVVCGVRVEDVEDKTMREIRYMDKLIDELAKGRELSKILRA